LKFGLLKLPSIQKQLFSGQARRGSNPQENQEVASSEEGVVVPMNDWSRVLQHAKRRVNPSSFATWFRPTRLEGTDNGRLLIRVPTHLFKKRLTETYGELLQAVLQEVGMPGTQLEFLCSEPESPAPPSTFNLANAHEALKNIIRFQDTRLTIEKIQKRVGEHFGVFPPDLKLRSNSKAIVFPRQVAMYLAKQLSSATLTKIGLEFGGTHHATVWSSIKKIEAQRLTDRDLNRAIGKLFDSLR
jgi:chromosomal replication initiation ATPase DnaA